MKIKKFVATSALLIFLSNACLSQSFDLNDKNSTIQFSVRNFGVTVKGTLMGLSGRIVIREDSVEGCHFNAMVRSATIDTGIALRDKHLRQEDYFDVNTYPSITISSTKIIKGKVQWSANADVTIKGITRNISIPFTIDKKMKDYVFKSRFSLNRRDFKVGGNSISLADSVEINLVITGSYLAETKN